MIRWFFLLVACSLLAACQSAPLIQADLPAREVMRDFAIEARFSLKVERVGEPVQSGSGRLSWSHRNGADTVLLASPLGAGFAELEITPGLARLRNGQGEVFENADADRLVLQVTGYALPVARLAAWLLGRVGDDGTLLRDDFARPLRLREAGWQIDYAYADESPQALPYRLNIQRASEVGLTLRIEEWRDAP